MLMTYLLCVVLVKSPLQTDHHAIYVTINCVITVQATILLLWYRILQMKLVPEICPIAGAVGLSTGAGGGGQYSPPKLGGGSGKRAQSTGLLISYYELWRERRIFLRIKNRQFFFTKHMANDDFSEPP